MDPTRAGAQGGAAFDLTIELAELDRGRLAVLSYLAPFCLDERTINRVEVVLEELLSNIVRHAREAHRMSVAVECFDGAVHLSVEDDGAAFNPLDFAEPVPFSTLENAALGGQGLPLIKRLSRSVSYDRTDARNRVSAVIAAA